MAEAVHKKLESMLPELEELERSGIFDHEEIRQIVRRRRNLEYGLRRRPVRKEDFLRAIQYEVNLDLLRRFRKKKLGIVSTRHDAEFGILNRIDGLFQRALRKFKGDLKLWLQYIEFSKRSHRRLSLSKTFGRALAIHPHNTGLWVMAAKFEFEDLKNVSAARALLQQGLRANPDSRHLWLEYFRMELLHTDKVRKRRSVLGLGAAEDEQVASVSDEFLAYKTASVVFRQATKTIPDDIGFRLSFLPIYHLFEDTAEKQQEVYDSVKGDFPSHPLCWDALARRHWVGVDTATLSEVQVSELERRTTETFRKGIATTENAAPLWEKYIQWCRERTRDQSASEPQQVKGIQRLIGAFKEASESTLLSEDMFEEYVHTLQGLGLDEEAQAVVTMATEAHPQSVSLWILRLKGSSGVTSFGSLCREALEKLPKEVSLPVWECWLEQSIAMGTSNEEVEHIFQAGLETGVRETREVLCLQYVDWALLVGGVKKARKVYQRLLEECPVSYSLYQRCISVEKSTERPAMKRLRELLEKAVQDHGTDYPGLWLDYIQAEVSQKEGVLENVGKLHWRAVKTLRPEPTADFIAQYSLLQTTRQT